MFKRKNTTDEEDLPQKRSRLSDEASTSGKYILVQLYKLDNKYYYTSHNKESILLVKR